MERQDRIKKSRHPPGDRRKGVGLIIALVLALLFTSGCSYYSAVPLTLKEVKDYVIEKEESVSFPLRTAVVHSVRAMKSLDFEPSRIEMSGEKGMAKGACGSLKIELNFDSITPSLTRIRARIVDSGSRRRFSAEDAFFGAVKEGLSGKTGIDMREMTRGLTPVYFKADSKTPTVAYIGHGERIAIVESRDEWTEIALVSAGSGYVMTKNIDPLPEGGEAFEEDYENERH